MTSRPLLVLAFSVAIRAVGNAAATTPEATDPNVARCATVIGQQLRAKGFAGRVVAHVDADRAQASIHRWEAPFSDRNRIRVATLIRVPMTVTYGPEAARPRDALEGRCGYTSGKLLATEVVVTP